MIGGCGGESRRGLGWELKSNVAGGALYEGATVVLESSGFETATMKRGEAKGGFQNGAGGRGEEGSGGLNIYGRVGEWRKVVGREVSRGLAAVGEVGWWDGGDR